MIMVKSQESTPNGLLPRMASLLQTVRRQGKDVIKFLVTLLTQPKAAAKAALFSGGS